MTEIADMPTLQAEDDGFLLQLKRTILEKHLDSLDIGRCETLEECVEKITSESAGATDSGSSLPLYVPVRDDDGVIQGCRAVPVWSGTHIDIPLYGDLCREQVRSLITGNRIGASKLYEGFTAFSPAFRVALLVHHICQIVLMHPLAAEAFVLGRYNELPFEDPHFDEFGVPSTKLTMVTSNNGLATEWTAKYPHSLAGGHRVAARINGWNVRVRGSQPKEALFLESWKEIRERLDTPLEVPYTIGGAKMARLEPAPSGRSRKRTGDAEVDVMRNWVESKIADGTFPMRGNLKDWKTALSMLERNYPMLLGRWTSEAMRKAYERRKRRGY